MWRKHHVMPYQHSMMATSYNVILHVIMMLYYIVLHIITYSPLLPIPLSLSLSARPASHLREGTEFRRGRNPLHCSAFTDPWGNGAVPKGEVEHVRGCTRPWKYAMAWHKAKLITIDIHDTASKLVMILQESVMYVWGVTGASFAHFRSPGRRKGICDVVRLHGWAHVALSDSVIESELCHDGLFSSLLRYTPKSPWVWLLCLEGCDHNLHGGFGNWGEAVQHSPSLDSFSCAALGNVECMRAVQVLCKEQVGMHASSAVWYIYIYIYTYIYIYNVCMYVYICIYMQTHICINQS